MPPFFDSLVTLSKTFEITRGGGFENHFLTFIFDSKLYIFLINGAISAIICATFLITFLLFIYDIFFQATMLPHQSCGVLCKKIYSLETQISKKDNTQKRLI